MVKSDLTAIQHLDIAKMVNTSWVRKGNAIPARLEGAEHNVSLTVTVKPEEWDEVREYIWENREFFSGISLLADGGDYDYMQPPYQSIDPADDKHNQARQLAQEIFARVRDLPLDLSDVEVNFDPSAEFACGGGSCDLSFDMGEGDATLPEE